MTTTYFWEKFKQANCDWFKQKLLKDKDSESLHILYGAFMEAYVPECDPKTLTEPNFRKCWLASENKEKFLAYLLTLLKEGKLKVKISDLEQQEATEEDKKIHGDSLSPNFRRLVSTKDHTNLPPQEAVNMIRQRWNSYPLDQAVATIELDYANWTAEAKEQLSIVQNFEQCAVLFTLPENEWVI